MAENNKPVDKQNIKGSSRPCIAPALLAATQAALSPTSIGLAQADELRLADDADSVQTWLGADDWQLDTALLYYGEKDDRVDTTSFSVRAGRTDGNDQSLSLAIKLDSLTGATPNGAVPQQQVQTFTRPSGRGSYQVEAGDTPLDDTFKDTRLQANASWQAPLDNGIGPGSWQIGTHFSKEYDYLSLGVNGSLSRNFDRNNRTLSMGVSGFYDVIEPEGRIPVPLSTMVLSQDFANENEFAKAFGQTRASDSEHKITTEARLSLVQILSPAALMQVGYSFAWVDGYQNDFLKLVSVVDQSGMSLAQHYESRPGTRRKHALYWQGKFHLGDPVLDSQYRFMTDDWSVTSHTLEARLNWPVSANQFIEPYGRIYYQDAADFFQPYLLEGEALPNRASADYRLAELTSWSLGIKYGISLDERDMSLRLSYYRQEPDDLTGPGQLRQLDLSPSLEAIIVQLGYRF